MIFSNFILKCYLNPQALCSYMAKIEKIWEKKKEKYLRKRFGK